MGERKPNVVFVFSDQQRWDTLGAYGNPVVRTPNLDALARQGVRFDNLFTTSPVCSPSRASLLTGRYPHEHGVVVNNITLSPREISVAHAFKDHGYITGYIGKWHLTDVGLPGFVPPEARLGFDHWFAFNRGHSKTFKGFRGDDPQLVEIPRYTTDVLVDEVISFIRRYKDRPFLLFCSIPDPHQPYSVREPYASMYPPDEIPLPESFSQGPDDLPPAARDLFRLTQMRIRGMLEMGEARTEREAFQKITSQYYGMISCIDENIGRILEELRTLDLEEDTIFVYTSDHGDFMGAHHLLYKSLMYEEACKLPGIIRYPREVPSGLTIDELVSIIDFMPTLLELAGLPVPKTVSGRSVVPLLRGEPVKWRDALFMELGNSCAIRTKGWKYILHRDYPPEMYHLEEDPYELRNLETVHVLCDNPDYVKMAENLRKRLVKWRKDRVDRQ